VTAEEDGEEPKQAEQESDHRAENSGRIQTDRSTSWLADGVLANDCRHIGAVPGEQFVAERHTIPGHHESETDLLAAGR
jgi:hypothetical protein